MIHDLLIDCPWTTSAWSGDCLCFTWIVHRLLIYMQCQLILCEQSMNSHETGSDQSMGPSVDSKWNANDPLTKNLLLVPPLQFLALTLAA